MFRSTWSASRVAAMFALVAAPAALAQGDDLQDRVNQAFGLRASTIQMLDFVPQPGEPFVTLVTINGVESVLSMSPHDVRSDRYALYVEEEPGVLTPHTPGEVREFRGQLLDVEMTHAAGSARADGLVARIQMPDGSGWWIEPIFERVEGAEPLMHVVYHEDDIISPEGLCGTTDDLRVGGLAELASGGGNGTDGGNAVAELACDADFEFYQRYGSDVPEVEARINEVINLVNIQYERDVQITHDISAIIVRSTSNDPYTSFDAETLLNQFRNHWLGNHGNIQRDMAQLFTGRSINGGTIGIAWVGAVCGSFAYSVVESDCCGSTGCATDLTAHELGHNWNADHCTCQGWTMNPFITCANRFHATFDIPQIIAFRNSRTCLGDEGPAPQDCPLHGYTISYGVLESGTLSSMDNSDNSYFIVDADLWTGTKHRAQAIVRPRSPITNVSRLDFSVELRGSVGGSTTRIYLRNWSNNTWTQFEAFSTPTTDTTKTYLNVANPNNYIHPTNRQIYVRVFIVNNNFDFDMLIDEVEATVYE
jgi:hypothetical protein